MNGNEVTTFEAVGGRKDKLPLKRKKNYAETKHRANQAAARATRLLRGVSAARVGAEVRGAPKELKGDTRLLRNYGGHHTARLKGEGKSARHQPPVAPTMRQPMALMDATTRAQAGHQYPDIQRLPHTL